MKRKIVYAAGKTWHAAVRRLNSIEDALRYVQGRRS
jgi:hypothetical protein